MSIAWNNFLEITTGLAPRFLIIEARHFEELYFRKIKSEYPKRAPHKSRTQSVFPF